MNDPSGYERLKRRLETLDKTEGVGRRRVFYLATPPQAFALASRQLDASGLAQTTLTQEGAWPRIVVEKPFGARPRLLKKAGRGAASAPLTRSASTASTIILARRWRRI